MTYYPVQPPYPIFTDIDGTPLENGYIYIGEENQNPITNPIAVTWDSNGLYPAAQPIRTIGGYPDRNGSATNFFINLGDNEDYSILIQDKHQNTVFTDQSYITNYTGNGLNNVDNYTELRAINGSLFPVYVRGRATVLDGGQGKFEWVTGAAPGTYTDNDGTIIVPSGGDGSGAWLRVITNEINALWFGMAGDDSTDNTAAFTNFYTDCFNKNTNGYIPSGIYQLNPFTMNATFTGITIRGESMNNPDFGISPTVLKNNTTSAAFITISGCYNSQIKNLQIDGNYTSDAVVYWPGTVTVTQNYFEEVLFCGATPTTGKIHYYAGTIQVDHTVFFKCQIRENAYAGSSKAKYLVHNENSNAFLIWYKHCYFRDADILVRFGAGSCSFFRCDFFLPTTSFIDIDSVTQPFEVTEPYTEGTNNVPFFRQNGAAGVISANTIYLRRMLLNSINDLNFNCQQPVYISGFTGGNINVNPMATYGVHTIIMEDIGLNTGKLIQGTGYPDQVNVTGWHINRVPQIDIIGNNTRALNITSDYDNNVLFPCLNIVNNKLVKFEESSGGAANCGFILYNASHSLSIGTTNVNRIVITSTGSVRAGSGVGTTSTDGFLYIPTCAGTPTGVPTAITGFLPLVIDSTNNKLYFYSNGAWRDAGP